MNTSQLSTRVIDYDGGKNMKPPWQVLLEDLERGKMKIEAGKNYRTRDGRIAHIYSIDNGGSLAVHGAVKDAADDESYVHCWTSKGAFTASTSNHSLDLIEEIKEGICIQVTACPPCVTYSSEDVPRWRAFNAFIDKHASKKIKIEVTLV